jgi:hypothetical protein
MCDWVSQSSQGEKGQYAPRAPRTSIMRAAKEALTSATFFRE